MLSHRRDQIVEGGTSIFRVTPRQKHPSERRASCSSIPWEYLDTFVVVPAARARPVYTSRDNSSPSSPPLPSHPLARADSDAPFLRHSRRTVFRDGIPRGINLVASRDLPARQLGLLSRPRSTDLLESLIVISNSVSYIAIP